MHRANRLHEDGLLGNFLRVPEGRSDACPLRALFASPSETEGERLGLRLSSVGPIAAKPIQEQGGEGGGGAEDFDRLLRSER